MLKLYLYKYFNFIRNFEQKYLKIHEILQVFIYKIYKI